MFQVSPLSLCLSLSLSLSTHNTSAMTYIFPIRLEKISLNFPEHYNVINRRAKADTVHVAVHVARIANDKTYIFLDAAYP